MTTAATRYLDDYAGGRGEPSTWTAAYRAAVERSAAIEAQVPWAWDEELDGKKAHHDGAGGGKGYMPPRLCFGEGTKWLWNCNHDGDFDRARPLLAKMKVDTEQSVAYFKSQGATCDCGIIFRVIERNNVSTSRADQVSA